MANLPKWIQEIQDRANAATKGPWQLKTGPDLCVNVYGIEGPGEDVGRWVAECDAEPSDSEFIAHARADVPRLIEAAAGTAEALEWLLPLTYCHYTPGVESVADCEDDECGLAPSCVRYVALAALAEYRGKDSDGMTDRPVEPRPAVKQFAERMEIKLRARDYKGGWDGCTLERLLAQLEDEENELREAIEAGHEPEIIEEAVDVANLCMMLADVADRRAGGQHIVDLVAGAAAIIREARDGWCEEHCGDCGTTCDECLQEWPDRTDCPGYRTRRWLGAAESWMTVRRDDREALSHD